MWDGFKYLTGLFLIRSIIGTQSFWGIISPYAISYFYGLDNNLSPEFLSSVIPYSYSIEGLSVVISSTVQKAIGTKYTLLISVLFICGSFFISSFITNPYLFAIVYGGMSGAASGLTMVVIVWPGWKYFPNKKNLVMAVSGIGYSGGYLWGLLMAYIINPSDIRPQEINGIYVFPPEISTNFVASFKLFPALFLVIGIAGLWLLKDPESIDVNSNAHSQSTALNIISTVDFWIISSIFFFGMQFRLFLISDYKIIGLGYFRDQELSAVGSFGSIAECVSTVFIGFAFDNYDPVFLSKILSIVILLCSSTLPLFFSSVVLYGIYY